MKKDPKDYYCSKHGPNGNPKCEECWKNLFRICNDYNAGLVMDDSTKDLIDSAR